MDKLPKTVWELIDMAERDARQALKDGHKLEMTTWHTKNPEENFCRVCLAGAVILNTLGHQNTGAEVEFIDLEKLFGEDDANKLFALNFLREGLLGSAVEAFYRYEHLEEADETARVIPPEIFKYIWESERGPVLKGRVGEKELCAFFDSTSIKAFREKLKELNI